MEVSLIELIQKTLSNKQVNTEKLKKAASKGNIDAVKSLIEENQADPSDNHNIGTI
jgi:hypothetical protein